MASRDMIKSLERGFKIQEQTAVYRIECKVCHKAWALDKNSQHPGNILHLLNHEAGHSARKPSDEEDDG